MIIDTNVTMSTTDGMPKEMEDRVLEDMKLAIIDQVESSYLTAEDIDNAFEVSEVSTERYGLTEEEAIERLKMQHIPMPPPVPPNAKGPQVTHLSDKRGNRKAICRRYNITMKYLRKQIKLAKREGIDISHWGV